MLIACNAAPPAKSKMADGIERGLSLVFGHSRQVSLNKFFDLSAPSMRKIDDGEKKKKKEKNEVFSGHYVIASSLPPGRLHPNDDRWNAARSCQFAGFPSHRRYQNVNFFSHSSYTIRLQIPPVVGRPDISPNKI